MSILLEGDQVRYARILMLRQALKLEIAGIKVVRGTTAYAILKKEFGWTGGRQKILERVTEIRDLILKGEYK